MGVVCLVWCGCGVELGCVGVWDGGGRYIMVIRYFSLTFLTDVDVVVVSIVSIVKLDYTPSNGCIHITGIVESKLLKIANFICLSIPSFTSSVLWQFLTQRYSCYFSLSWMRGSVKPLSPDDGSYALDCWFWWYQGERGSAGQRVVGKWLWCLVEGACCLGDTA